MKVREGIGELRFTEAEINRMESIARSRGEADYLLLRLWGRRGLRVSESLGLHKRDLRDKGVWITQKGGDIVLKILPPQLYEEMGKYSAKMKPDDLLFSINRRTALNWSQQIAKEADIENWERAHPHRWRHFFGTFQARRTGRDPWKVKSLMGHKDLRPTAVYVDNLSPEEELEELS